MYAEDIKGILAIALVLLSMSIVVYMEIQVRRGRIKLRTEYSFGEVLVWTMKYALVLTIACVVIYFLTQSFEVTLTIWAFILSYIIYSAITFGLLSEYQAMRRKKEMDKQANKSL